MSNKNYRSIIKDSHKINIHDFRQSEILLFSFWLSKTEIEKRFQQYTNIFNYRTLFQKESKKFINILQSENIGKKRDAQRQIMANFFGFCRKEEGCSIPVLEGIVVMGQYFWKKYFQGFKEILLAILNTQIQEKYPSINIGKIIPFIYYLLYMNQEGLFEMHVIDFIDEPKNLFDILLQEEDYSSNPTSHMGQEHNVLQCIHLNDLYIPSRNQQALSKTIKKVWCTCSKSECQKNYCPCFRENETCGSQCICHECHNKQFIPRGFKYTLGSFEQLTSPDISFSE